MRTKMRPSSLPSLRSAIAAAGDSRENFVRDAGASIPWSELATGSALYSRGDELRGRSVLVATHDQLTTISALIELDGVASRIVLSPPDLSLETLPYVIDTADVEAIVSDRNLLQLGTPRRMYFSPCSRKIAPATHNRDTFHQTEWILLTSGTTGLPKLVVHTLSSLAGAIERGTKAIEPTVWGTFYDIRRYGGLQILLRAAFTGTSFVLSDSHESTADFLARAASCGVTHISGTPSQWRRALMSPASQLINPKYVRLSGEIVDQAILKQLQSVYPQAHIVHAFASTEAGVAFEVHDCAAGFPSTVLENTPDVAMKVENDTLRICSARTAARYLGDTAPRLRDADAFVDTGDIVELKGGRYCFAGRKDGIINVGGLKVYPEEIEAVINRHPEVQMSLVRAKRSPLTGSLVFADVVLRAGTADAGRDLSAIQDDILLLCRESLSSYKVPVAITVVPALNIAESGKVLRHSA
jgi:acyl-CoA synthetase (AMP-forming)/AMP-acid ligase II